MLILGRLSAKGWHLTVLMIWFAVGAAYNSVIWYRFGRNAGISWFAGYLLEFIFLVENIFIFNIVIEAFKVPLKMTTKALHIVVWAQIMFEMIFFMGLAAWLRSFKVLPYLLGVWLVCCGFLAARGEPTLKGDIMETKVCRLFTSCLGDRLSTKYEKDGKCLLRDDTGTMRVSLLGLVVFVLLLADFLLEIDVVLTKIEELPNHYIAFTSSAVAAFSMPDLFFVSKGLLRHCVMLKYGIGFVLILFGAQMLLSSVYTLRPIVGCGIIVGVLLACIVISAFVPCCCPSWGLAVDCKDVGAVAAALEASASRKQNPTSPALDTPRSDVASEAAGHDFKEVDADVKH
jgi:tellurite resistance protein TerC